MISSEQSNYNLLFIQRQEQLFFEQIKKCIDVEVKLSLMYDSLNEFKKQYDTKLEELENLNILFSQATESIKALTAENLSFKTMIENLNNSNKSIVEMRDNAEFQNREKDIIITQLRRDLEFKSLEMKTIVDENNNYKQIIDKKPIINKKKPSKNLEEETF